MGCFDTIMVFQRCAYCKEYQHFDAQTKDMSNSMWTFHALDKNWFNKQDELFSKSSRDNTPTFLQFPFDKESKVWKSQGQRMEARARVRHEWGKKLRYVEVITDCHSHKCQGWARERDRRYHPEDGHFSGFGRSFDGKIAIVKHGHGYFFIAPIYDIVKNDKRLPRKKEVRK